MIERKVGEVFSFVNVKLKVEIGDYCDECYFEQYFFACNTQRIIQICGNCNKRDRSDENNVIFKKV